MLKEVHTRTHPARTSRVGDPAPVDAGASQLCNLVAVASDDNDELAAELAADDEENADGDK
jgi:hypothetical protein